MRQMKDSGIEWIGKIPETWAIERMKGLFIERNERNCKGRTLLSVSQYFGIRPKSETDIADSHIAESYDDYKEVYQGDFVMNIMLAWNGSYAVSEYDGMVSPAYCVFKFRKNCCKKYFHYLLRTNGYPTAFKTMSRGVIDSRLRLYPEQFYTFPVIIPSVNEQLCIADYLDEKCGEIDSLIGLQEQMIEKLKAYKQSVITEAVTKGLDPNAKLVPSGINWIGEIPEGWQIGRFYFLNWIRARLGWRGLKAEEYTEAGYPFLSAFNIINNRLDWTDINFINQERYDESPEIKLNVGDVLLVKDGAGIGKCAKIDDLPYGPATVNGSLAVITTHNSLNYKFLYYYLQSNPFLNIINLLLVGMGVPHLTQTNMKNIYMPLPNVDEQHSIAAYLDEKCADIDRLIALKQQKIESLKDYKKSVIYEAVTGKTEI